MAEEKAKLNIYGKLQKCRVEVQKKSIKKTGKNTFSNYDYLELGDFLPYINEVNEQNKLCTVFHFGKEEATLTIINSENEEEKIQFGTPVVIPSLKGCNEMQNVGGTQTYARRYLYFMAYEISENDLLNQIEEDKEKAEGRKKIDAVKVQTIKKLIEETNTNEAEFCKWAKIKAATDITNSMFYNCIKMLEAKKSKMTDAKELEGVF